MMRMVAALPTTRGGPAQPWRASTVHRFLPYYGKLARKAVTKVSGKVLDTPLLQDTTSFAWAPRANAVVLAGYRGETRADDRVSVAAMEDRKREGYF